MNKNIKKKLIVFETTIPVFSWFIAKGMAVGLLIVVGVFGLMALVTISHGGTFASLTPDIYFALGFVGMIFFFTYVAMALLFPKGFRSIITISEKGISQIALSPTKAVNLTAIIGGILAKSPGAVGTGLLAEAGDNRMLNWKEIRIGKVNVHSRYIYFSSGRFGLFPIGFFCPEKRYKEVISYVKTKFPLLFT